MPDLPIELSAATLPVPVQIALVLAATITLLAIPAWLILIRVSPSLETPSELRDVRRVRQLLLYLVPFVLFLAVVVSALFIVLETWNTTRSPADSAPEQRDGDSASFNHFPSEKSENTQRNDSSDGVADSAN